MEDKDFAFPRDTYVYGYRISFFDLDKFKQQIADGSSEVSMMGKLFDEEFLQVTKCLKKSTSVRRVFRKLL